MEEFLRPPSPSALVHFVSFYCTLAELCVGLKLPDSDRQILADFIYCSVYSALVVVFPVDLLVKIFFIFFFLPREFQFLSEAETPVALIEGWKTKVTQQD